MQFYGSHMANGEIKDDDVFDKMKNAAGDRQRNSDDAEAERQPVSLSAAAALAQQYSQETNRSQTGDNSTTSRFRFGAPRAAPQPPTEQDRLPQVPTTLSSRSRGGSPSRGTSASGASTPGTGLDRSKSARVASSHSHAKQVDRSVSQRHAPSVSRHQSTRAPPPAPTMQNYPPVPTTNQSSGNVSRSASKKEPGTGTATPRRREKPKNDAEVVQKLKAICTAGDPSRSYRNLSKIGQGYVVQL
jgi:p21-activated kinase 1